MQGIRDQMTDLDRAQDAANGGGDAERLAFFRVLADAPLLVLLEREVDGDILEPRIFDLEAGQVVLAFDDEGRLAAMGEGPLPYAELPGRVLARLLSAEGLGLGLNLGAGTASEMLLPKEAMVWLTDLLDQEAEVHVATFGSVQAPSDEFVSGVERILQTAPPTWAGLAQRVALYGRGETALLVIVGAVSDSETALATAMSEALRFANFEGLVIDIAFSQDGPLPERAVYVPWPTAATDSAPVREGPSAPGMDSARPPILR